MSFFQNSVLNKHLKAQDTEAIKSAYEKFAAYFHNIEIQQNIRDAKEEQFQEGFLRELFVNVLGYTLNPQPNYNLTTELKNEKGAKKADGAILQDGKALCVIELKGTNTKDLDKINAQAFNYKNNQTGCIYVITSNFEKLRFFIHHSVEHLEFNLFTLTETEFRLLWLCLNAENLFKGIPLKIKEESLHEEEKVTKQLYKDYAAFRMELWQNMVKNNEQENKLLLFKKTQKLLDRFLFIFFAEDSGLLPPNSISRIVKRWKILKEEDAYKPLYDIFKQYFGYIHIGRKGQKTIDDIFAYNGGLFMPDVLLDSIMIDDDILHPHVMKMTNYDFQSEVDVNILGHIFENSLSEIENITAILEGQEIDKSKTKRKKDGVFYTPKYITKYIVENTVGKLCDEKKAELDIDDEEYAKGRRYRKKDIIKGLDEKLQTYRNWLLNITICDPACGSGAFLNQALEFLVDEHDYIAALESQLHSKSYATGTQIALGQSVESHILEKNIYGVDINEESVDIAKLSLWLRTAQKGRKLTTLNNNLKCGNSLIDDPAVAGDKAFNWQNEFPTVFEKGGFDVVIGNPPYVQLQSMGEMSDKLSKCGYQTYNKSADLYCLFYERGCHLLKPHGYLSYITSNKWLRVNYGESLRKFLTTTVNPTILIDFPGIPVFADAVLDPHILILINEPYKGETKACALKTDTGDIETELEINNTIIKFSAKSWTIVPPDEARKLEQMKLSGTKLKDLPISIYRGILTGYNDAFYIDEEIRQKLIDADPKSTELIKPMVRGRDIMPFGLSGGEFLINTHNGIKDKNPPLLPVKIDDFPVIKEHLDLFYERLERRGDKGDTPYNLRNCAYLKEFDNPKIIYPNMTSVFPFVYDESRMLSNDKSFILTTQDDSVSLLFLTALFNSSLAKLWIWWNCPELGDNRREIRKVYFEHFPVPQANEKQTRRLSQFAKERIKLTSNLQMLTSKFTRAIQRRFNLEKMSGKLQNWYLLSYAEFIKELSKKKVKLNLSEEAEWEEYFMLEARKAQTLKAEIEKTDREIDQMVYELYGLTEEEIMIVESK